MPTIPNLLAAPPASNSAKPSLVPDAARSRPANQSDEAPTFAEIAARRKSERPAESHHEREKTSDVVTAPAGAQNRSDKAQDVRRQDDSQPAEEPSSSTKETASDRPVTNAVEKTGGDGATSDGDAPVAPEQAQETTSSVDQKGEAKAAEQASLQAVAAAEAPVTAFIAATQAGGVTDDDLATSTTAKNTDQAAQAIAEARQRQVKQGGEQAQESASSDEAADANAIKTASTAQRQASASSDVSLAGDRRANTPTDQRGADVVTAQQAPKETPAEAGDAGQSNSQDHPAGRDLQRPIGRSDTGVSDAKQIDIPQGSASPSASTPSQPATPSQTASQVIVSDVAGATAPTTGQAANAGSPSALTTTQADDASAFNGSVSRALSAAVRQRGGSLTVRLSPPAMGTMRIQMTIDQGNVTARFEASTQQAHDLLTSHMDQLRSTLEARGLNVQRIQVQLAAGSATHTAAGQTSQQDAGSGSASDQSQAHHDAGDGQSRGAFDQQGQRSGPGSSDDGQIGPGPEGAGDNSAEPGFFKTFKVRLNAVA